MNKLEKTFKSI
jgi:hypothetical protein